MKKNQKQRLLLLFISIVTFNMVQHLRCADPVEVGKYDGGEYCYYHPGSNDRGMYPAFDSDNLGVKSGGPDVGPSYFQQEQTFVPFQGAMNFAHVRNAFPIFNVSVNDHPLVYLDSGATAQMPQIVLDAMVDYYQNYKSNIGRGLYTFAADATQAFENARGKVAAFIGAKKEEIIFTSGATAAINLACHVWADRHIEKGDEIVVSEVEHNANFVPWQQLAQAKGAILKMVPVNDQGVIDLEVFKTYLSNKTKLVAITHQSNILGVVNDVAAIAKASHGVGAKVLVDAAQSIVHQKLDVQNLQCDFLAFSGHKLFGPTGVGVLYINKNIFDQCVLHNFGGGMVYSVTPEYTQFKLPPHCFEPGTQAIAQVIGLGAAIEFIEKNINFEQAQDHETQLVRNLAKELQNIPGITIISPIPADGQHSNLVTFVSKTHHAYDIAAFLDLYGIAVRSGFHCVQIYHDKLGGNASVRVSFSVYNTQQEVDWLVACLKKLVTEQ